MKLHLLKTIRLFFALVFFLTITFFFCDFAGLFPRSISNLMRIQFVPALLTGSISILIALVLLTFLMGRIYCSIICPMGVFQDIIAWFAQRSQKKKHRYRYRKSVPILRYTLLAIFALSLILHAFPFLTFPALLLDPYSNYGRIGVSIFRPIVVEGNNLLNWFAMKFNSYHFYQVTLHTVEISSFLLALAVLLTVGIMAWRKGRLFCNTICPVGSLLGLISRGALFRMVIDPSKCNHCGMCERSCKSECINSKERAIDFSRCVTCFNCLGQCRKEQAMSFGWRNKFAGSKEKESVKTAPVNSSRRTFLTTSAAITASIPFFPAWATAGKTVDITKLTPITPPGSKSLEHFKSHCTACHLCVTHCPQQVLKPAGFNFGLGYAFKPRMVYYEMAFCNYHCTICSNICPNGAIQKLTVDEKRVTQIGIAQFEQSRCIVATEHTSCGACSEHCPVQAVRMEPYLNGLTLPHVYPEFCIGCGGCESICPARPVKAINVLANAVHRKAQLPKEEKTDPTKPEKIDFGF
ncbi:MAG: 4Fe-4S binding protein [Candidatus Azobacteroides sp.]|nr:4Fe-4S binding protein [Candidatus Azobacteroides sp.]